MSAALDVHPKKDSTERQVKPSLDGVVIIEALDTTLDLLMWRNGRHEKANLS